MSNRNATASWHGYNHQSKVGVLVALRKINELLKQQNTLDGWIIKFESAEDFDILHGSKVDSRHQVKAYKNGKYPNSYKDVLQEAYPVSNGKVTKVTKAFQYRSVKRDGSPGEIEVDEDARYLHTIVQVIGFGLTEQEFRKILPSKKIKYISNPNKVKLYKYKEHEYFCELSKSDEKSKLEGYCLQEIEEILIKENNIFKGFKDRHRDVFLNIVDMLDTEVRSKHLTDPIGHPELSLKKIFETVISTESQKRTNIQIMREAFMRLWDDYVEELRESNSSNVDEIKIDEIGLIIREIYCLKDEDFIEFIMLLNPDRKQVDNVADSQILITHLQADSLKDIMYRCLCYVTAQNFDADYFGYEDGRYTLSLINREKGNIGLVVNSLYNNREYLKRIYERKFLINGQIDNYEIVKEMRERAVGNKNNWKERDNEDIVHIMNSEMKFITVSNAIKKMNEG